jgi:hypothetical protein
MNLEKKTKPFGKPPLVFLIVGGVSLGFSIFSLAYTTHVYKEVKKVYQERVEDIPKKVIKDMTEGVSLLRYTPQGWQRCVPKGWQRYVRLN